MRRARHRAAFTVAFALVASPVGAAQGSGSPGSVSIAPTLQDPACARFDPPRLADGTAAFRDLPRLAPASTPQGRVLALDMTAARPRGGSQGGGTGTGAVMIGDLAVTGVPLFQIAPRDGVRVQARDPRSGDLTEAPAACLDSPRWAYGGTVWPLQPGDLMRIHLDSALDFRRGEMAPPPAGGVSCEGANLHTHGLLVSPYKARRADGRAVYGDYVLDVAAPVQAGEADPCGGEAQAGSPLHMHALVPGGMDYETRIPASVDGRGGHPRGVFWYHPHPHGYGALLTSGGTTGVITVGELSDYACVRDPGAGCARHQPVRVRELLLKDAEVAPDGKAFRLLYDRSYDLEDACNSAGARGGERAGQCVDWKGRRWLFTVNGVRDPAIADTQPDRVEVWRIVNASPNVTYRLSVKPMDPGAAATPLDFQVLSLEGAAPAPDGWVRPGTAHELLLMPAARAEIAFAPPRQGGTYALEQLGFTSQGDVWPAMRLAQARFQRTSAAAPPPLELHGPPPAPTPAQRYYAPAERPNCGFAPDAVRHIYFVQRPSFIDDRRRRGVMGLLAAVQRPGGEPQMFDAAGRAVALDARAWQALLHADPRAPAYMHSPYGEVCTYLGHTETWVIENDTDEDHNFHIHQSQFQLALDHAGHPAFFSAPPAAAADPLLAASDAAVEAADGHGREAQEAILAHDTIPVPRGISLGGRGCDGSPLNARCRPGRVTIRIRFDRDEQVGTFLYHCHILQHEDAGMMALVHVLCPPGDAACAARHPQPAGDGDMRGMGGMAHGGR